MAIKVVCLCGRRLTVRDDAAGRKVRCPSCQSKVSVPAADADYFTEFPPDPFPQMAVSAPTNPSPSSRSASDLEIVDDPNYHPILTKIPREPWYYGFLESYAKLWLAIAILQFGVVMLAEIYVVAATALRGDEFQALDPLGLISLVLTSLGIGLVLCLIAAPILLAVDSARNLRAIRWQQ